MIQNREDCFVSWSFFLHRKVLSYEVKNAPRGCALARICSLSQATALGARFLLVQKSLFLTAQRNFESRAFEVLIAEVADSLHKTRTGFI